MKLTLVLSLLALAGGGARVARAETKCGAHQHVAVEQNDDEGGTVKRCVCDEGWNANGPGAPCKKVKPDGAKKPKS
jgi:hypothetical protein